jgi:hypothetical protein
MKTPATMYCGHCGSLIEADSKFCAQCGNKLHDTSANRSRICEAKVNIMARISYRDRTVTTRAAPDCLDAVRRTLAILGAEIHTSDSYQIVGKLGSRLKTRLIGALIGGWSVSADTLPVKIRAKVDTYGERRELEIVAEEDGS